MTDILFCIPGNSFSDLFLQSWSGTLNLLANTGITWKLANGRGPELAGLRNSIATADCEARIHFWIDSDMVWTPDDVVKLMQNEQDICSGVYKAHDNTWTHKADGEEKGIVEADYCGFGFVRYDTEILKTMDFPYFFYHPAAKGGWDGEDVSWCKNAQRAGHKVYVDYDCRIGHEKRQIL